MSKKINHKKVIRFFNNSTPEELCYLIYLMADKINVPIKRKGVTKVLGLDQDYPVIMNGICYQINTEDFFEK